MNGMNTSLPYTSYSKVLQSKRQNMSNLPLASSHLPQDQVNTFDPKCTLVLSGNIAKQKCSSPHTLHLELNKLFPKAKN